jgi:hypothetical protein
MKDWAQRQAEIHRQMKEAGETATPETAKLLGEFVQRARPSIDKQAELALLLETCKTETAQWARRYVDRELAAYIEMECAIHAARDRIHLLDAYWLLAGDWNLAINHEEIRDELRREAGPEQVAKYQEALAVFRRRVGEPQVM